MKQHSILSPSGAHRWLNCSGSVLLKEDGIERDTTAADEGTLAHRMAELKLTKSIWNDNEAELNACRKDPLYKLEMDDYITSYINFIDEQNYPERYIEQQIRLDKYIPDLFGTCDCLLMDGSQKKIHIIDLKYGFGKVDAKDNPQLRIYAMGAAEEFLRRHPELIGQDFTIDMTIYQPRAKNTNSDSIKYKDLVKWFNRFVKPAARKILSNEIECNTGEWCRYCDRQIHCRTFNEEAQNVAINFLELSDEEIADNYTRLKELEKLTRKTRDYLVKQIKDGNEIKGYRLTQSDSYSWIDSEELDKKILDNSLWTKPTVNALKRTFGKERFEKEFSQFVQVKKGTIKLEREKN